MPNVDMLIGLPASGKSRLSGRILVEKGSLHLCRDLEGGRVIDLLPKMEAALDAGKDVVLDCVFATAEARKPFIEAVIHRDHTISAHFMDTAVEDCMFNAVQRMIEIKGKLLSPAEIKDANHPNIFSPGVIFKFAKEMQRPTLAEGFSSVDVVTFKRNDRPDFINKAVIVDYDGTLRECVGGNGKYPIDEKQIRVLPNRVAVLRRYADQGYRILGATNQSGVHKGELTEEDVRRLIAHTMGSLIIQQGKMPFIDTAFCPHQAAPPVCYCRKPNVGMGVALIHHHKLDRKQCIYVGDQTVDKTFAKRCGFQHVHPKEFFA